MTLMERALERIRNYLARETRPVRGSVPLNSYQLAAKKLGVTVAHVRALAEVETGPYGAFLPCGHPVVLFERHIFHRQTSGKYSAAFPKISSRKPGGYGLVSDQPSRLMRAKELDYKAAVMSASWGLFQIMGFNYRDAGFGSAEEFEQAMFSSIAEQFMAWINFLRANPRMVSALQADDWPAFASLYNGPAYRKNRYDKKLESAYRRWENQE